MRTREREEEKKSNLNWCEGEVTRGGDDGGLRRKVGEATAAENECKKDCERERKRMS
jgi:hypothetical protein